MLVLWLSNVAPLLYAIIIGFDHENIARWADYRYRVYFDFIQPNIYSASWSVVLVSSIYFWMTTERLWVKRLMVSVGLLALICIFLARSESVLLFCIGTLVILMFTAHNVDARLRTSIAHIVLGIIILIGANIGSLENLNRLTSGRILLWERGISYNLAEADYWEYFSGRASIVAANLKYAGFRQGFQANRAQIDNTYLALFIQNGAVGLLLFFLPLVLLLRELSRTRSGLAWKRSSVEVLVIATWIGTFFQMWGLSVIPSYGNVTNMLLFAISAASIAKLDPRYRKSEAHNEP